MKPTDTEDPSYFLKVVDCQYACPSHTPVPEYIRLIAQRRFDDAYMVNWESNVFPGILGRTCDRPCEPACRRGRVEEEPVAICRLKRVAADFKSSITSRLPEAGVPNGKKVALIGAGPSSLTVARDLAPLGYELHLYDNQSKAGGFMRSEIPAFRLPESVLDEEIGYILNMGIERRFDTYVDSLQSILDKGYDAVFVGTGAPRGRDLPKLKGRYEGGANIQIGLDWLSSVAFGHVTTIGKRVIVLGGGNTAMDCCRTARRLGGEDVTVIVRSPYEDMKASPWEKEDAAHEGIPILNNHVPLEFVVKHGRLAGMSFQNVNAVYLAGGKRELVPTGEPPVFVPCDDVLVAIGQENAFPWIERSIGIEFDRALPVIDPVTLQSTLPGAFFGGDAAMGPKNIITSVAHGHQAAISIDLHCQGKRLTDRPAAHVTLVSQKMGIHEWSYDSAPTTDHRSAVPTVELGLALKERDLEVELGFDLGRAFTEARRCLNCDAQTVFTAEVCIECDECADVCPTSCITFTGNGPEEELRPRLTVPARNTGQDLLVSETLGTGKVMVKDEDVCLHCGLCAERCPTGAWDMARFNYEVAHACDCKPAPASSRPDGSQMKRIEGINDFVVKFANVNGTGSASANHMFAKAIFRMGIPVSPRNIFPSNIQGLPTWYEVRVSSRGYLGRRGGIDLMVCVNPQSMEADVASVDPGGYFLYNSTKPLDARLKRDDIEFIGIPLTQMCMQEFPLPRLQQLMKNVVYVGALAALIDIDGTILKDLLKRQFKGKEKLITSNIQAMEMGYAYALEHFDCPLPIRLEKAESSAPHIRDFQHILMNGNTATALGAIYGGATVAAWYPITPSTSVVEGFSKYAERMRIDPGSGREELCRRPS